MGKEKADVLYPFEHVEFINYTWGGVSIHPVATKIQASFRTQRKETTQVFHHEASGVFKTVTELNICDRRKLRMDQQYCRYTLSHIHISEPKRRTPSCDEE